ncbi:MAG: chemotaxis protein MotA [bacterium]|jgi:chemotaxis protein MotA
MNDKIGIIFGFISGMALIFFGIIWPDNLSNYYAYNLIKYETQIKILQKTGAPSSQIKAEKEKLEVFKKTWIAAIGRFIDLKSFLIVFGGSYAASMIAFPFSKAIRTFSFILQIFTTKEQLQRDFHNVYQTVLKLGEKRANNEIITESDITQVHYPFLKQWIEDFIITDIVSNEMMDEIMSSEIEMYNYRSFEEIDVLEFMGRTAPAFGMVGTVVGLILMLSRAGGEGGSISDIMGSMSVALITTLYGVLIAQLLFLPVASKRYQLKESNIQLMEMTREGVLYLRNRELPEVAGQDLAIYLPPKLREEIQKERMVGGVLNL